jgi:hypothetical protein
MSLRAEARRPISGPSIPSLRQRRQPGRCALWFALGRATHSPCSSLPLQFCQFWSLLSRQSSKMFRARSGRGLKGSRTDASASGSGGPGTSLSQACVVPLSLQSHAREGGRRRQGEEAGGVKGGGEQRRACHAGRVQYLRRDDRLGKHALHVQEVCEPGEVGESGRKPDHEQFRICGLFPTN